MNKDLMEKLSAQKHDSWSKWMKYLFSKSYINQDGYCQIPKNFVDRWTRQMNTDYYDLSEDEKESDRKEVRKFLQIMEPIMEHKNYKNIVMEAKDLKAFKSEMKKIIDNDTKASKLRQAYKKDSDKIVDLVDYLLGKYEKEVSKLMKQDNINYDEFMRSL